MAKEVNLIDYLPDILKEIREFKAINTAENPELLFLWDAIEDTLNDQFVDYATENGVKRWESILKILPKGTETLDVRKFRIISRLNEQLPYTYEKLKMQLETLCGDNGYSLVLLNNEYKLIVRVELSVRGKFDEVESLLNRTVPANIVIDLSLMYNQHSTLSKYTNTQLSNSTHYQLRNEVIN
ncbi:MAG: hypothetical protein K0S75_2383 [Clostridia bacterium]|jgi:hypothetical protein|nr:hypothetical protein [Clostridia bacterium]